MSGKAIRETIGFVGVITSLIFVGLQTRQSNIQAKAAAYQEIGIATASFHYDLDDELHRLNVEADSPEAIAAWGAEDWERYFRQWLAGFRLAETVLLQIDEGLLDPDAMERLGYYYFRTAFLSVPASACLWPTLSALGVGQAVRDYVEQTPPETRYDCQLDMQSVRASWVSQNSSR